ncbi:hypothetical protein B566_EDAN010241 [Ephemera danica]|nr:hypothetical protein B566_EDAN010241 [Ephemera danica]
MRCLHLLLLVLTLVIADPSAHYKRDDLSGGFRDYLEYVDCGSRPVKPLPEEGKAATSVQSSTSSPETSSSSAEVTPSAVPKPPKDFSYINGKYYIFSPVMNDWNSAQTLCRLHGAGSDLVSIESEYEFNLISAIIAKLVQTITLDSTINKPRDNGFGLTETRKFGNGGHYLISTVAADNFDTAREFCLQQGSGSDLVSLETESEVSLMKAALNNYGGGRSYYIGLNDRTIEGTWFWVNENKPATFIDSGISLYPDSPTARNDTDLFEWYEMMAPQQIVRHRKQKRRQ